MRTRNARTFDYVDSRNLQGEALRIEQQGIRQGRIGPSSPVAPERSRGGDGQVTVAEKRASVKGQQERGTLGGGKKDRCQRGKSCGLTCIAGNEDCIIDFPEPVRQALSSAARMIMQGMGGQVNEEADKLIGENIASLYGLYGLSVSGKAKSGQALYHPELARKYAEFLSNGKYAVQRGKISDEELDKIWSGLDKRTKQDLMSKGQPPKEIKRDAERGKNILRQLLETGFRDEITGQPYSWKDIQPDHKVPISLFKGDKKDVEKDNLVMVHKGYNGMKGSLEGKASKSGMGEEFVNQGLAREFNKQASRSVEDYRRLVSEAASKDAGKNELRKQLADNSPLWSQRDWIENVMKLPTKGVQMLMSLENKLSGVPNRFSPSYSQGRNYAPKYASQSVNAAALLLNKGIPVESWPPGLLQRAAKDLSRDLTTVQSRSKSEGREGYDQMYKDMFYKFTKGNVPPELAQVFSSTVQ